MKRSQFDELAASFEAAVRDGKDASGTVRTSHDPSPTYETNLHAQTNANLNAIGCFLGIIAGALLAQIEEDCTED